MHAKAEGLCGQLFMGFDRPMLLLVTNMLEQGREETSRYCTTSAPGLGLIPDTTAPGVGSPVPHLHRDWAHRCHTFPIALTVTAPSVRARMCWCYVPRATPVHHTSFSRMRARGLRRGLARASAGSVCLRPPAVRGRRGDACERSAACRSRARMQPRVSACRRDGPATVAAGAQV